MSSEKPYLDESVEEEIAQMGRDPSVVRSQIETFQKGIKFQELAKPCTLGDGVEDIADSLDRLSAVYDENAPEITVVKFVPASGAASRMFKELQGALSDGQVTLNNLREASEAGDKEAASALKFLEGIKRFAFYSELRASLESQGANLDSLLESGEVTQIINQTLNEPGLNYSRLPKGIIKFHLYGDYPRTAFEEHMAEASHYALGKEGKARLHFTLSPEHMEPVKSLISHSKPLYEKEGAEIEVNYSAQKPTTDTIAVGMDNRPIREDGGELLFRPGGARRAHREPKRS